MTTADPLAAAGQALRTPWAGPLGGLPPYDRATPAALEAALQQALDERRRRVQAIADDPSAPTFANTAEALEDSAREVRDLHALLMAVASTAGTGDMPAVARRLLPLAPALDLEVAQHEGLGARLDALWQRRQADGLAPDQVRLLEVLRQARHRAGAGLPADVRQRLAAIQQRLSELGTRFCQNLLAAQTDTVLWLDDPSALDGLPEPQRAAAAAEAAIRGGSGWAIPNQRNTVWPVLTHVHRRSVREAVWRRWNGRCAGPGEPDNRPVVAEILQLRGERARLLGHASHAHAVLSERMLSDPDAAMALMQRTWQAVRAASERQLAELQALAEADGPHEPLAPWDRLYWSEQLRRRRFALDSRQLMAYLPLPAIRDALFWVAGRLHGLRFEPLPDAPVLDPSIQAFSVWRGEEPVGLLYLDLFHRPGKQHGSHQHRLRAAERFRDRVLPISNVVSNLPPPAAGQPVLLPWEYANVLFHEFGHALHMLLDGARYPSLGSLNVAWDMVELPSLLHEAWLRDRELLRRFARHHQTGEPLPEALIDRLEASLRHDRIFSVQLDYLGAAIVDMRLHRLADGSGRPIDPVAVERQTLAELGMPAAWDLVMTVTQNQHSFAGAYDAGLYAYLWSDVMAADVLEAFQSAPGGLYDPPTTQRWRDTLLTVGHSVPAADAFRAFRGREPDAGALMRRFGLGG